ncbi:MAG: VOC family protein [Rhodospirillaceae bacterium]|nr:VOC family protein [Rhodospirillaceae bacterium]
MTVSFDVKNFRRGLAVTIAIAAVAPIVDAFAQERASALQAPAVRRTTLVVEDLDKSIDFFQRLGLTKWYDAASTDTDPGGVIGASDLPLTADPKSGRIVIMRGNDERIGMIGLLAYDRPPLASARSNLMGLGTSDIIIMMEVPDIQAVYGRLQQAGVRFHRTPYRFTVDRPDGTKSTGMRMFAYDPDGHLIEIAQPD